VGHQCCWKVKKSCCHDRCYTFSHRTANLFKIKKAKSEVQSSEGNDLCLKMNGLGKSHAGNPSPWITDLPNGTPASKLIEVGQDHILEIGLTPNRRPMLRRIRCTRNWKALLQKELMQWYGEPIWRRNSRSKNNCRSRELNWLFTRYAGVVLTRFEGGAPSPNGSEFSWNAKLGLGAQLIMWSISPNFILHDLGRRLHAFRCSSNISEGNNHCWKKFQKERFQNFGWKRIGASGDEPDDQGSERRTL